MDEVSALRCPCCGASDFLDPRSRKRATFLLADDDVLDAKNPPAGAFPLGPSLRTDLARYNPAPDGRPWALCQPSKGARLSWWRLRSYPAAPCSPASTPPMGEDTSLRPSYPAVELLCSYSRITATLAAERELGSNV